MLIGGLQCSPPDAFVSYLFSAFLEVSAVFVIGTPWLSLCRTLFGFLPLVQSVNLPLVLSVNLLVQEGHYKLLGASLHSRPSVALMNLTTDSVK